MTSEIILYTQPGCPQCRMVHILLDKRKAKYTEIQDTEVMKAKGIVHTPVIEVDGRLLTGKPMFDYINGVK